MYARSTLKNYAERLPEEEMLPFLAVVSTLQGEFHGKVEIVLSDALKKAGLDAHVSALEKDSRWLYLTGANELQALSEARYGKTNG